MHSSVVSILKIAELFVLCYCTNSDFIDSVILIIGCVNVQLPVQSEDLMHCMRMAFCLEMTSSRLNPLIQLYGMLVFILNTLLVY